MTPCAGELLVSDAMRLLMIGLPQTNSRRFRRAARKIILVLAVIELTLLIFGHFVFSKRGAGEAR